MDKPHRQGIARLLTGRLGVVTGVVGSLILTYLFLTVVGTLPNMEVPPQWIAAGLVCAAMVSAPICILLTHQWTKINALNIRLSEAFAELEQQANTDQLTGLCNRQAFYRNVAARKVHGWIVLGDIDHFKNINDTYGHDVGDEMLANIGETIRKTAVHEDCCARLGGEEFAIFLPGATGAGAKAWAELLRVAIAARELRPYHGQEIYSTISLGLAKMDGSPIADVLRKADQAMYLAKRSGRNRVVCAPDSIRDGASLTLAQSA